VSDSIKPDFVTQLQRVTRDVSSRLRRWFDPPLEADARPLEIREGILDRIEAGVEEAGGGKRELPSNRIAITVLALNHTAREHLRIVLDDLEPAIRARLAEMRCTLPFGCAIDVRYITKRRADWTPEQHFTVELDSRAPAGGPGTRQLAVPALLLTVIRGQATERFYRFTESQVLIGRTPSPIDHTGRPRHNHVVFLDEGDEHNGTVGRAHASIRFEAGRLQYRLFDEGSHNGTRLLRNGTLIEVPPRNPVGVALLAGDEIQLGTAAITVEIGV